MPPLVNAPTYPLRSTCAILPQGSMPADSSAPSKLSFEAFIGTCTPLMKFPELEVVMRQRVEGIVRNLLGFQPDDDPVQRLTQFLRQDRDFLGVLLALTNLSQERFLRIITAQRFAAGDYKPEWGIDTIQRKINSDDQFAGQVAQLFLEGRNNEKLIQQIADFYLDQLSLPEKWSELIRDETLIGSIVRKKLAGEYTDKKGEAVEQLVSRTIERFAPYQRGQVALVGGKEVDHAVPNLNDPLVMVMVSYMETTSSSQTTRANEQREMYLKVLDERGRYPKGQKRAFVNVVDGGGWLARRSDLRKLYESCDYCLNLKTLDMLGQIIRYHVPTQHLKGEANAHNAD